MRMLDRKLVRDLRRMWAQALAIALVMASGVATFVLASGAYHSLEETRAAYYLRYRFADVFAEVRRAPEVGRRADRCHPRRRRRRAAHHAPGAARRRGPGRAGHRAAPSPCPTCTEPRLNLLHLREGRLPERERTDEVTVNEGFAKAHRMQHRRHLQGAAQRQEARAEGRGHRAVAGVHLRAGARRPDARRPPLRHPVDVGEGAGRAVRPRWRLQRVTLEAPARRVRASKSSSSSTTCWRAMAARARTAARTSCPMPSWTPS